MHDPKIISLQDLHTPLPSPNLYQRRNLLMLVAGKRLTPQALQNLIDGGYVLETSDGYAVAPKANQYAHIHHKKQGAIAPGLEQDAPKANPLIPKNGEAET